MSATPYVQDLFALTLHDGLRLTAEGKEIIYRVVRLRETNVADERAAQRAAERVMVVGGVPTLMVSDVEFRFAMTARHVEFFECDGQRIPQPMIDVELLGKLSSHDLALIEQRVFLIALAAEVRYGNMAQADFDAIVNGRAPAQQAPASPQPVGQAASDRPVADDAEPGPALLADYAGSAAAGAPAGDAR